jgi:hypothetical protein
MVPAADNNVVDPGKGCMAVPDCPVQVLLERLPCISQAKGHPLVLEQAEGGGTGRCWLRGALPPLRTPPLLAPGKKQGHRRQHVVSLIAVVGSKQVRSGNQRLLVRHVRFCGAPRVAS